MIQLHAQTSIMIATKPADFRCGIDGFQAICRKHLGCDPLSGSLFVFINRNKTMIRALVYEVNGYWLMTKRLSKGKFRDWPTGEQPVNPIQAKHLRAILAENGYSKTFLKNN